MHHLPSRYIPCDGRLTASTYFDPRSPHGERPVRRTVYPNPPQFQSTLPAWGATVPFLLMHLLKMISIHAPRGGSDEMDPGLVSGIYISIHAPRGGERLLHRQAIEVFFVISNPRSPQGERPFDFRNSFATS